jgi:hypothetical protein
MRNAYLYSSTDDDVSITSVAESEDASKPVRLKVSYL